MILQIIEVSLIPQIPIFVEFGYSCSNKLIKILTHARSVSVAFLAFGPIVAITTRPLLQTRQAAGNILICTFESLDYGQEQEEAGQDEAS